MRERLQIPLETPATKNTIYAVFIYNKIIYEIIPKVKSSSSVLTD